MSKKEANRIYPSYYKIWDEKKDLDQIPEAEKRRGTSSKSDGIFNAIL